MSDVNKNLIGNPDRFSFSPLFAVLPSSGKVNRLRDYTSSLFARYEALKSHHPDSLSADDNTKAVNIESDMLKEILEWLSVSTEDSKE